MGPVRGTLSTNSDIHLDESHNCHDNDCHPLLSNFFYRAAKKGNSISYPLWFISETPKSNTAYTSTFRKWKTLCQDAAFKSVQSVRSISKIFEKSFKKKYLLLKILKNMKRR